MQVAHSEATSANFGPIALPSTLQTRATAGELGLHICLTLGIFGRCVCRRRPNFGRTLQTLADTSATALPNRPKDAFESVQCWPTTPVPTARPHLLGFGALLAQPAQFRHRIRPNHCQSWRRSCQTSANCGGVCRFTCRDRECQCKVIGWIEGHGIMPAAILRQASRVPTRRAHT